MDTKRLMESTLKIGPFELYHNIDPDALFESLIGLSVRGEIVPGDVYLTKPLYSTIIAALIVGSWGHATLIFSDSSVLHFDSVEEASKFVAGLDSRLLGVNPNPPKPPVFGFSCARSVEWELEYLDGHRPQKMRLK